MLEIHGDQQFIEVHSDAKYDGNLGSNKLVVTIVATQELFQMKYDLERMQGELAELRNAWQEEDKLRKNNPALKDLYDKYQVVFGLIKDSAENTDSESYNGIN